MLSSVKASSSVTSYAVGIPLHITHFPLLSVFNFLDLPSSFLDVPINFKLIDCLHFKYAVYILLTDYEQDKRLIMFVEVCQAPLILMHYFLLFNLPRKSRCNLR